MTRPGNSGRWAAGVALVFLAAVAAGGVFAQGSQPVGGSYTKPAGVLIAPGENPSLIVLYTGDVIGHVDACG